MRISVIGLPASGKSTLARRLSAKLGVPHIQLDEFWFRAGGHKLRGNDNVDREPIRKYVRDNALKQITQEAWVSDGFYSRLQPEIADRADFVIFLDIPLWQRLFNHLKRTFHQRDRRLEISLWDDITFFPELIRRNFVTKPKLLKFLDYYRNKIVRLRSQKEIAKFFLNIGH